MKYFKRVIAVLCGMVLISSAVYAEVENVSGVEILLPHGSHVIFGPDDLVQTETSDELPDEVAHYIWKDSMEISIFTYNDMNAPLKELAAELVENGTEAQVREITGTEFLFFTYTDEWDGAVCVGYTYYEEDGYAVEITFFCGTQEAMDLTVEMMESFH